jgi:predicted nucleotidyltransferase
LITNQQIQEVTAIIVEEIRPERVFLFGSYAFGIPDKNSDVDFIVIVKKALQKKNRIDGMVKLNLKTALPHLLFSKDFKMYSVDEYNNLKENKFSFLHDALQNSKLLYER